MANPENPAFHNQWQRFEATPIAKETEIVPRAIVFETRNMIGLLDKGEITPEITKSYLDYFTFPFLKNAADGSDAVFNRKLLFVESSNPDINEAADFTNVVFAWMHYFAKSNYLPDGFSRKGVLQAPENKEEFVLRLREIRTTLPTMFSGVFKGSNLWSNLGALRTLAFLEVGSSIPLKFVETDKEKKQYEDSVLAKFTKGLDLDL